MLPSSRRFGSALAYRSAWSANRRERTPARIAKSDKCTPGHFAFDFWRGYTVSMLISEMDGQGVKQFLELGSAFVLSAAIGLEREIRHKSAGLRTYTVVGTAAALFLLISKYGFMNVLANGLVVLDPSRVAAQIVTGIGFIGAGLIFVREDRVQGLTTAATVWLVTAIGMACAAGLLLLALGATIAYFIVAFVFPRLMRLLPGTPMPTEQIRGSEHD
jgi:putative Mg2+ transporter-C (MgtC) family protein